MKVPFWQNVTNILFNVSYGHLGILIFYEQNFKRKKNKWINTMQATEDISELLEYNL